MAGGTATIGLTGTRPLDPPRAAGAGAFTVLAAACDTLTALDPETGEPRPALAAAWEVKEGGKRIELSLRTDAEFHDGAPVDARSIAESLSRVARPETASPWAGLLAGVEGYQDVRTGKTARLAGVRIAGPRAIEIALEEPAADLPVILAHPALTPVTPVTLERDPEAVGARPVCSGPYRFQEAEGDLDARLVRHPGYPGVNEALLDRGRGLLNSITVMGFDDAEDAHEAFLRGEVDAALVPEGKAPQGDPASPGYAGRTVPEVTYLALDLARPPTGDVRLRRALSLAIDRLAIIDAAFGDRRPPATGWLAPEAAGTGGCAKWARRTADPAAAVSAFVATGDDPAALQVKLVFDGDRIQPLVGEAIGVQVRNVLRIDLDVEPHDGQSVEASLRDRGDAGAAWILTAAADLPIPGRLLASLFGTAGADNRLGFSDPAVDALLGKARRAGDPQERARLYGQAEDGVCDQMPAVPLWVGVRHWSFNPERLGIEGRSRTDVFGGLLLRHAAGRS